jgi:signal peptidase
MRSPVDDRVVRRLTGVAGLLVVLGVLALCWPARLGGSASYVMVSGDSMEPTMHSGDIAVLWRQPSYRPGDIVAFRVPEGEVGAGHVVIHRVIAGDGRGYVLRGDNKRHPDPWRPGRGDILGRRVLLVPRAGQAVLAVANPLTLGFMAGLAAALFVGMPRRRLQRSALGT